MKQVLSFLSVKEIYTNCISTFKNQLDTTHLRSGRGRFNPDSGSVGDNGESGVTAESRKRRIVTESGQRRRKATASELLISDMFTPLTCIVIK